MYARERNENLPCIRLSAIAILLGTAERQKTRNSRVKKKVTGGGCTGLAESW